MRCNAMLGCWSAGWRIRESTTSSKADVVKLRLRSGSRSGSLRLTQALSGSYSVTLTLRPEPGANTKFGLSPPARGLRWWGGKKLWLFPHILRSEKCQRSQIYFFWFFSIMIWWKFLNLLLEGKKFIFDMSLYHNFENVVRHSIFLGCHRQN